MDEYKIFKNNTTKWVVGILAGLLLIFVVLFSQQIQELFVSLMGEAQEQVQMLKIGTGSENSLPWAEVEADSTGIDSQALTEDNVLRIDFSES